MSCISLTYKLWQNIAKDEYESNFISAVVPPGEIGVKFEDIGALEDVKKALNELVILPMRRPELFSHGNLLRVLILCLVCILIRAGSMHFHYVILRMFFSALQRNITFWASWNWENPPCKGSCNRSWGKLYQHNWFDSYIKGMQERVFWIDYTRFFRIKTLGMLHKIYGIHVLFHCYALCLLSRLF